VRTSDGAKDTLENKLLRRKMGTENEKVKEDAENDTRNFVVCFS
jgi:hypothetical protein